MVNEFVIRFRPTRLYFDENKNRILISGFWPAIRGKLVHVFDIEGNETGRFMERPADWLQIAQTGNFERLAFLNKTLYISYPFPYKIEKYNWSGEVLKTFIDSETDAEIEEDGAFKIIDSRIIDLQLFQNHLLALLKMDQGYQLDIFDHELNKIKTIPGNQFELDHMSFLRVVDDQYLVIRQLDLIPHLLVYSLNIN